MGLWFAYKNGSNKQTEEYVPYEEPTISKSTAKVYVKQSQQFQCDGRQHCSQMTSRAEAEFFIRNCPNTKMDGDHDGVPCENDSRF